MGRVNLCLHPRLNNGGMYGGFATVAGTVECIDMGYWRFLPCFKTRVSSPRLIMKNTVIRPDFAPLELNHPHPPYP